MIGHKEERKEVPISRKNQSLYGADNSHREGLVCPSPQIVELQKAQEVSLAKEPSVRKRYRIVIKAFLDEDNFLDTFSPDFFDKFKDSLEHRFDHCGILKETIVFEIMEIKE